LNELLPIKIELKMATAMGVLGRNLGLGVVLRE
jgi:hypothetical protein